MNKEERPLIRSSVRSLVEFLMRSGDLDTRKRTTDPEAMLKGGQIHRKLQRQAGSSYHYEVPLKLESKREDFILSVEGRADGIYEDKKGQTWVDEIKGTYMNIEKLEEPVPVHLAQAKCYAFMLAKQEHLSRVGVRMTYVSLVTEKIHSFKQVLSYKELKAWYEALLSEFEKWISFQMQWRKIRNASMQNLPFPFPYREGQRRLVSSVYHAIQKKQQLFCNTAKFFRIYLKFTFLYCLQIRRNL